ncbi:MAG: hypothetical protein ACRDD7_11710 [Peptostreptococcaceae bacterium]
MKKITFGELLEKLLYLSNQKKSSLAKAVGYDVSYISKWITGKNLPTQKSISNVCKTTSEFIVNSLTIDSMQKIKTYFEIESEIDTKDLLQQYLEENLREAYMATAEKNLPNIYRKTYWEDAYNSMMHVNPRLRKQYLSKDMEGYVSKSVKVDLIICTNLYNISLSDKINIAEMKSELSLLANNNDVKVRVLMGLKKEDHNVIDHTILVINLIRLHPNLNFKMYNCDVTSYPVMAVVKDRIFHTAIFTKNNRCLFTTMSKEKRMVNEMYYSLEDILKEEGKEIVKYTKPYEIIKNKTYIQYIMGTDLRWLIGSMNELLMPFELFDEISKRVFGDDEEMLSDLENINVFLNSVTYASNLKVLIYESELKKYISSGKLRFFNKEINLSFEERERHLKYIENIIEKSENVEIKLVDGNFVEDFKDNENPSLYLSKSTKILPTEPANEINDYAIIMDREFKDICDEFFDEVWQERNDVVISDKSEMLERLEKALVYSKIINGNYKN